MPFSLGTQIQNNSLYYVSHSKVDNYIVTMMILLTFLNISKI